MPESFFRLVADQSQHSSGDIEEPDTAITGAESRTPAGIHAPSCTQNAPFLYTIDGTDPKMSASAMARTAASAGRLPGTLLFNDVPDSIHALLPASVNASCAAILPLRSMIFASGVRRPSSA